MYPPPDLKKKESQILFKIKDTRSGSLLADNRRITAMV